MKNIIIIIFIFLFTSNIYCEYFNVYNQFKIDVPKEFSIRSISSNLNYNEKFRQYWMYVDIDFIYNNSELSIVIEYFGNGDLSYAKEKFAYSLPVDKYSNNYNSALNQAIIKNNSFTLKNDEYLFYEFVSDWASGYSSDVISYKFMPNNNSGDICIIRTINAWYSFDPKQKLKFPETDFWNILKKEAAEINLFYSIYRNMIINITNKNIISTTIDSKFKIDSIKYNKLLIPSIPKLRWRSNDSISAPVIGYVQSLPHTIVQEGKEDIIDGIKGKWLRIRPINSNKIGWAFDGYLHEATKQELSKYSDE